MENSVAKEVVPKNHIWLMFGLALVLILWGNHSIFLWNQDEAAYAGFAANMLQHSNWLIPDFIWSDVHRKTPLHFWLIALSYLVFGVNEFAVRFSSSMATIGTLAVMFFWGRHVWGEKRMLIACYILLSSILFVAIGKVAVTDATLLFLETVCALSMARLVKTHQKKWVYIFWIAISFGMLTKGPPILIFGGTMGLLLLLFHPDGKRIWKLKPWFFFPLSVIPLLTWGYFAWQQDGGVFISWLIDWYILKRVGGNVFGQTGPPGYYIAIFMGSFILWLPFVLPALFKAFTRRTIKEEKIWAAWLIGGWLLYEFLSSKLPAYTIAAHPAVAIAIATVLLGLNNETKRKPYTLIYFILSLVFLMSGIGFLFNMHKIQIPYPLELIFIGLVLLFSFSLMVYWLLKRGSFSRHLMVVLPISLFFNFFAWTCLIPATQIFFDGPKKIIKYLRQSEIPTSAVVYLGHHGGKPPSLPFYIQQAYPGMEIEADTIKVFEAWYNTPPPAAFILSEHQVSVIERLTHPLETKEITTNQVDRQNRISYFVVLKK